MAYENIMIGSSNFCIGPQVGTYCYIDTENDPVTLKVRDEMGTLVRTYTFYPQDILKPEPYDYDSLDLGEDGYYKPEPISVKYIGPKEQSSFYNNMVFYTLERRGQVYREYYTYERDPDPFGPYKLKDSEDEYSLVTDHRPEYNSNIIRKWILDTDLQRLVLEQVFYKNSDDDYWFDASTFAIKHRVTDFSDHTTINTGEIEMTTTSGLKKYDFITLGPSSDTDNPGAMEEVYVHKIEGNTLKIKTYEGYTPPKYEYVIGDSITMLSDILLFSNPRPLINELDIAYGYVSTSGIADEYITYSGTSFSGTLCSDVSSHSYIYGSLYSLDQTNYGAILNVDYSGIYCDIGCAVWNQFFNALSFVKGSNLLHLDLDSYDIKRSQNITLYDSVLDYEYIPIYDIDVLDESIYKLQDRVIRCEDGGGRSVEFWSEYNLHIDSMIPYSFCTYLTASNSVLCKLGVTYITIKVRDQFGVGLLDKNIWVTKTGDIGSSFTPTDGYLVTDSNGLSYIRYDAGSNYQGFSEVIVEVDGANSTHGSEYIYATIKLIQYKDIQFYINLLQYVDTLSSIISILQNKNTLPPKGDVDGNLGPIISHPYHASTFLRQVIKYTTPIDSRSGWYKQEERNSSDSTLIEQFHIPFFITEDTAEENATEPYTITLNIPIIGSVVSESKVEEILNTNAYRYISQNFISRHLDFGNVSNTALDQYVFVQEAVPAMWSEKNNIDTDFWIRIRPFAYNLDPSTLVIKLKEVSYLGEDPYVDVVGHGAISMFDAGSGLLGIDFYYNPSENFHHSAIVYVKIEVYDVADIPNLITLDYWFKLIADYRAPYIENHDPPIEGYNVSLDKEISFDLKDEGEGVDINTLEIFINSMSVTEYFYEEYEPGNYHISCNSPAPFHYGQEVNIIVRAKDISDNENSLLDGWRFYCVESDGPWFDMDNTVPDLCSEGLERDQDVSMQVYAINDTGIDYDSIRIEVGGKYRNLKITPIVYRLS